jgi:hypothetical protein
MQIPYSCRRNSGTCSCRQSNSQAKRTQFARSDFHQEIDDSRDALDAQGARLVAPKTCDPSLLETLLSAPDHGLGLAGGQHDLGRAAAIRRQKDDLGSPNVLRGLLRLAATAASSLRSAAPNRMSVRLCIPKSRTCESAGESPSESKSQISPTKPPSHPPSARRSAWSADRRRPARPGRPCRRSRSRGRASCRCRSSRPWSARPDRCRSGWRL